MDLISRDKAVVQLSHNKSGNDDSDVVIQQDIETVKVLSSAFEGMTNGEVIKALFPEVKVEINGFLVRCVFIEHEFTTLLEWWDAPYKAESEE